MRTFCGLILLLLHLSIACLAGDVQLFANHRRAEGYPFLVKNLRSGDVVSFSDGHSYTIDRFLGAGGTTVIYSIKEDPTKALRLPSDYPGMDYLYTYILSAHFLEKYRVPSVHLSDSFENEYAVVDRLTSFMTFDDFVKANTKMTTPGFLVRAGLVKPKELPLQEMKENFLIFARSLAYTYVGDMHDKNLVYDFQKKEWLLMDWAETYATSSQVAGFAQFDFNSPLELLLAPYGYTENLRFTARSGKYSWLQDMIQQAHDQIRLERQRGFPLQSCSHVHTP